MLQRERVPGRTLTPVVTFSTLRHTRSGMSPKNEDAWNALRTISCQPPSHPPAPPPSPTLSHIVTNRISQLSHPLIPRTNTRLHRTQLQYMYVISSPSGSPALFTIANWFHSNNADWFEELSKHYPTNNQKMDLRSDGYHELQEFDTILASYNELCDSQFKMDGPEWMHRTLHKGKENHWEPPEKMHWTHAVIDAHTMVVWAGPHRVIRQPGATTHVYMSPFYHTDTSKPCNYTFTDNTLNRDWGIDMVQQLLNKSWCVTHFTRDGSIDSELNAFNQDTGPEYPSTACPQAINKCCSAAAPAIHNLWHVLYSNIPSDIPIVSYPPTTHIRYDEQSRGPSHPPHIDYCAM